jgi:Ca2+-dependent lipid-binding protein
VKPAVVEEKPVEEIKKVEVIEEEKKEEAPLTSGQLSLTLTKATLTRDTEMFGKMDPYVGFEYNGVYYKTKVAEDMGKKPVWNQVCTVSFPFTFYLDLQAWC